MDDFLIATNTLEKHFEMLSQVQGWPYSTERCGNTVTFDRDVRSSNDVARLKRQSKEICAMEQYTPRERSQIVEIYIQQNKSIVKTQRAWRKINKVKSAPSANTLYRLYERFSTDEAGETVTVNQERYRDMISDFLMPIVHDNGMEHFWFQQDGAPPHTARATINFLKQLFPGRLMSKNGDFEWPPRSPDLTAPDFFLWGYLKSKVYVNKPRTLDELKTNIRQEIAAISAETLFKTMENAAKRALLAMQAQGDHLRDIIFNK
ncbi:PREDICTED: uncharacterized protein LOC108746522 [Trachymyrmex septentrionalis]|uniref:uncharacterized protein LOC108746522 n=3 Tax=Trachymyrmex septentrionalis TaxID=34720 RepID=UPI00084F4BB5|nr:PREDICTED: uncharacterized protein LOC108746522 [Trachymyrmex septentrionalis]